MVTTTSAGPEQGVVGVQFSPGRCARSEIGSFMHKSLARMKMNKKYEKHLVCDTLIVCRAFEIQTDSSWH
jgi:hypothetical protein